MKILFFIVTIALCTETSWGSSPRKIIGGSMTSIKEMPYIVSIGTPYFGTCGGVIISKIFVLTAAHCFILKHNTFESRVRVLSGTSDILDMRTGEVHNVVMIYYYDKFIQPTIWSYDIAILELEYPMNFDETRQPIPLPTSDDVFVGREILTGGWGVSSPLGTDPSRYLQKINMNITTDTECVDKYPGEIDSSLFCGKKNDGGSIGYGDSGGPVVYNGVLIGIVDSGEDVDDGNALSIFSNIYFYKDWINNVIRGPQNIKNQKG